MQRGTRCLVERSLAEHIHTVLQTSWLQLKRSSRTVDVFELLNCDFGSDEGILGFLNLFDFVLVGGWHVKLEFLLSNAQRRLFKQTSSWRL